MDDEGQVVEAHNAYGAPPGSGISIPAYYLPTPSVKNRNNYFPQTEVLGEDEMRITFMGSNPWPPRISQAGTSMMVECGPDRRFFFDLGPGCLRNIVANQVPVAEINDIFISHLHVDHYGDLPYLWQFAPFNGRFRPLRVYGPSGRTPEMGTASMCHHLREMGKWTSAWAMGPMVDGYEIDVTEFDFEDDGGVVYDQDGETVLARFALPRQAREDGLCIADFFRDAALGPGQRDVIGFQVVTVGQRASDVAREWFADNRYQDYLYLHGLGVEMAEAMAEYVHTRIRAELGYSQEDARTMEDLLRQEYRGSRYSFGYPACPRLEDQEPILALLGAERIGVNLSDEFQLHPEQSTSALVVHHPRAKYFSV